MFHEALTLFDYRKDLFYRKGTGSAVIDRSAFLTADRDYTRAQRKIIDARLSAARKGPYYGPFETAEEMIASMKSQLKKRAAARKTKRGR